MLVITINAFINVEICFFVVIYERKVCVFEIVYLRLNIMLLQLLYY
jgi:hypothetical protein